MDNQKKNMPSAAGNAVNRPVKPASAGTAASRPVKPAATATTNRPAKPASAGTAANRPVKPASAGAAANRPVKPAATGASAKSPVKPAATASANRPVKPVSAGSSVKPVAASAAANRPVKPAASATRPAKPASAGAAATRPVKPAAAKAQPQKKPLLEKWFGKNEALQIVVKSLFGAAAVCVLLAVFIACKPSMDYSRAKKLAEQGNAAEALRIVRLLEADGYSESELESIKRTALRVLIADGKFQEAYELLEELPKNEEAEQLRKSIQYNEAIALYKQGKYTAAAQVFYQMNDYENSVGYYADCRCALAVEAYLDGNEQSAYSLLLDVPDVAQRIQTAAYEVAQDEAQAQLILSAEIFQTERLTMMEQTMEGLNAARGDMPNGKIAAGARHTLGLSSNGTVYAAGDNSRGQLNVTQFSGVTQVAAGAYHSVVLLSDGTVAAAGDNSQGQCDVSEWRDIIAIAASAYDTIALKSDGTVVACGMHAETVSGWRDVTHITGGSYSMGCIYNKGAMLASHGSAQMDMGIVLYDLSVCGAVSAGILYDGTMVCTYENAPQWGELISVTVGETCILAIDVNGQVRSYFYRGRDAVEISVSAKATEIVTGGTHHAVLTEDGRVECFGNNDYGQCNTADWRL